MMNQHNESLDGKATPVSSEPENKPVDTDRREALRKIGYTTPALLGLLASSRAANATPI